MMFVQSLRGISHNKIEDTREEHIELAVIAFDKLAEKAMKLHRVGLDGAQRNALSREHTGNFDAPQGLPRREGDWPNCPRMVAFRRWLNIRQRFVGRDPMRDS